IYGIGILLFELLTGRRLFQHRETVSETVRSILEIDIADRIGKDDAIHPEIKPILIKSMSLEPSGRYTWPAEMTADIKAVLRKNGLHLDRVEFEAYLRGQFEKELLIDKRRLKKLFSKDSLSAEKAFRALVTGKRHDGPEAERDLLEELHALSLVPVESHTAGASLQEEDADPGPRKLQFPAGSKVFSEDDQATHLYVVESGKVRLVVRSTKKERTVTMAQPGDLIGECAFLFGSRYGVSAQVVENSVLVRYERRQFLGLIPEGLSRQVLKNLAGGVRRSLALLTGSLFDDDLLRLMYALLSSHQDRASNDKGGIDIELLRQQYSFHEKARLDKYLIKLESLRVLDRDGKKLALQDTDRLEGLLRVLSLEAGTG
ncbi:MAG: cyclic nucleotide-binding domain-containing protein, partial [Pseudomonadota bacterium]